MTQPGKTWTTIDVIVSSAACEAVAYGLMEAGALGTEVQECEGRGFRVTGYLETPIELGHIHRVLATALRIYNLIPSSIIELKVSEVSDRDWLAEWKKHWQPVEVGGRFVIAPPWSEIADASDRIVIRIEPGMAFGTGTHETTRLCLKAIGKHFHGGSFLDVGTGTGILAIAAAKMFSNARVEACDTDAKAIEIARQNARLNDLGNRISFRVGTIEEQTRSADLVCANLTAPVIIELLPLLIGATCGRLLLSGVLDSQLELVQIRLQELGLTTFELEKEGEWMALVI